MHYTGSCCCGQLKYHVKLGSPDEARTSICHCKNCQKFTGGNYGITTKVPRSSFNYTTGSPQQHEADNGSGVMLHRDFCGTCGSGIIEYGGNAGDFIYVFYGSFDDPAQFRPKGEFFTRYRAEWMPQVPDTFQKREIKE
ncbi:hypothetical protein K503DRAFT_725425 [Rhizopogon vinicolor AM-OR11-026]|uniref:CENP-V/GFA domain-containing protein n=1 Tax=Rhizopogon vinicolor AM-OR11-026 TaxID=1314800 RepID=A0A1B7MME7_9AGAM|nr:hypothetical protein K503DRAFT_725425 [Rhizopogon vinicolor AM-OR11-026]